MTNTTKRISNEVSIQTILIETMPKNEQQIKRIKFFMHNGEYISWKPTYTKTEFRNGFMIEVTKPLEFGDIPDKVTEINNILKEKGICKIKADYTNMITEEGDSYNFIRSAKTLDNWEIVKEPQEQQIE